MKRLLALALLSLSTLPTMAEQLECNTVFAADDGTSINIGTYRIEATREATTVERSSHIGPHKDDGYRPFEVLGVWHKNDAGSLGKSAIMIFLPRNEPEMLLIDWQTARLESAGLSNASAKDGDANLMIHFDQYECRRLD